MFPQRFVLQVVGTTARQMKARKTVLLVLLALFCCLFGVYHVGLLDGESIWTSRAASKACIFSSFKAVCQQEEFPLSGVHVKTQRQADEVLGAVLGEIETLQGQLRELQEVLHALRWSTKDIARRALGEALKQTELPGMTGQDAQKLIDEALEKLEYNQVQMPDFARKASGATIVHSKTSASFRNTKGILYWAGLPLLHSMKSPEVLLEPANQPGNCWSFAGSQGHVFIKLPKAIFPRAVTLEHISVRVSPGENISSAPKDFAVYGMKAENEEQGLFLGEFTYMAAEHAFETFQLKNERSDSIQYVKLEVLSNWGHPEYTCVYRLRVHGDAVPTEEDSAWHSAGNNRVH
ncbi:SUN domain-containing protein 3-like [Apteryx mantelli]|uniref:SUN domain-containing protein 3-like n=2 Tax=Apteryx mantelli TaxID=2696672 RepID=A0ABM4G8F1_9AVES